MVQVSVIYSLGHGIKQCSVSLRMYADLLTDAKKLYVVQTLQGLEVVLPIYGCIQPLLECSFSFFDNFSMDILPFLKNLAQHFFFCSVGDYTGCQIYFFILNNTVFNICWVFCLLSGSSVLRDPKLFDH